MIDESPLGSGSLNELLTAMDEAKEKCRDIPTLYICTTRMLASLKKATESTRDSFANGALPSLMGVPVEHYDTLTECVLRHAEAKEHGNPVLLDMEQYKVQDPPCPTTEPFVFSNFDDDQFRPRVRY